MTSAQHSVAILAVAFCSQCGGSVDDDSPAGAEDAAPDASCLLGTPACPPADSGSVGSDGACNKICAMDSDCDAVGPYRKCSYKMYFPLVTPPFEGPYGSCINLCDPVDPWSGLSNFMPCGAGFQCQPLPDVPDMTACLNWSDQPRLGTGEACEDTWDCEPGHICAAPLSDGGVTDGGDAGPTVCRRWCHTGSNECGSDACVGTGDKAGSVALGLCPL